MTSRVDKRVPDGAQRVQWSLAAVLSLLFAIGSIFLLLLTTESMHTPGGVGRFAFACCVLVFLMSLFAMGASLGMAALPAGVAKRDRAGMFAMAMGLVVLGLPFVYPTPLVLCTAPVGLLMWLGAGLLFVRTRRAP